MFLADARLAPEVKRKYCRACGSLIPHDATYCPHCGALQEAKVPEAAGPKAQGAEAITKRRHIRLTFFFISLAIFIITFILGSMIPLSRQDAQAIVNGIRSTLGTHPTAIQIFRNNITLCLLFLIPLFGPAFMAYVGYSTGVVLAAAAILSPTSSPLALAFASLLFPWTWLEFSAYSLASTAGLMIIVSTLRHKLRKEVIRFLIALVVSVALLTLAAVLESLAITISMA
jgi:hypothetical protein